jgi:hypothetical protein
VFRDFRVELPILGDARTCLETLNASASELGVHLQASRPARRQWIASLKSGGTLVDAPDHCRSDRICSPWVMTTPCDHAIGSMVRDVWGPAPEILDTITVESILNAG